MPNFANIVLTGHLGRDPETREAGKTTVTSFSVAVKTGYGERSLSTWYNVSLFGQNGERAQQHLHKGDAVTISGEPSLREYEAKDGSKRSSLDVKADKWAFAGGKKDGEQKAAPATMREAFNDDLPPLDSDRIPF